MSTAPRMNVREVLEVARAHLHDDVATAGVWPHLTAALTRQAIESTMHAFWARKAPGMQDASKSDQLLALPYFLPDEAVARDAGYTWWALSEACHQRGYEVGLTAAELDHHIDAAEALLLAVGRQLRPAPS